MEEFNAHEFIDGWSESLLWERALRTGSIKVDDMLAELIRLEADNPQEDCAVDWEEVRDELQRAAAHRCSRTYPYSPGYCAECGDEI